MRSVLVAAALICALDSAGVRAAPAELYSDHPLNGSLWDTRSGRTVSEDRLLREAQAADWVLIGEKHDNAEHHRRQAEIVAALGRSGRRFAVVWEMADPEHAAALKDARANSVADLGEALDWEGRGWPAWPEYQPIAEAALAAGLPMLPGKPAPDEVRALARGGELSEATTTILAAARQYSAAMQADLLEELADSHCGKLPEAALAPMARVQHFWDVAMAEAMRQAKAPPVAAEGAILIAGSGHVREDRAVPWHLEGEKLTVALVEVVRGQESATDYPAFDPRLFDFVWFTPRVDEKDPCAAFP
ncbi:MAG: ChaN family lipoprotein [Kiloniellaceae bacterium]